MRKIKNVSQHNDIQESQRSFEVNVSTVRTEIIPIYIVSIFDYIIFDKPAARYWWPDDFWITRHYFRWTEPLRMTPAFARKQRVRLGSVIVHLHCQLHTGMASLWWRVPKALIWGGKTHTNVGCIVPWVGVPDWIKRGKWAETSICLSLLPECGCNDAPATMPSLT